MDSADTYHDLQGVIAVGPSPMLARHAIAGPFRLRSVDSARRLALDHPVMVTSSSRIKPLAFFDFFA